MSVLSNNRGTEPTQQKNSLVRIIIFALLSFCLGFAEFVMIGIIPEIASNMEISVESVGNIVGYYGLTCAIATPLIAMVTAKMKRKTVFTALLFIFNIGNLLTVLMSGYWALALSRMLTACTSGPLLTLMLVLIPHIVEPKTKPIAIAVVLAGFTSASVLGVPLATTISFAFGWRSAYILVLGMGLIASLAAWISLVEPPLGAHGSGIRAQLLLFKDPCVLINAATIFTGAAAVYVFYTYMTPILEDAMHLDGVQVSTVLLIVGIAGAASNFLSGFITRWFGRRSLPILYLLLAFALGSLAISINNVFAGVADMFGICLLMYSMNSTVQLIFLDTAEKNYPEAVTLASSLHPTAFNAGIAAGSFLGSYISASFGMSATGPAGSVLALVAAGGSVFLIRLSGISFPNVSSAETRRNLRTTKK